MSSQPHKPIADLSSLRIDDHSRKSGNTGKRLGWFAAVLLVVLAGAAAVYRFKNPKPIVEVTTARSAANAPAQALLNASGYVTPRRRSSVAAKITGKVIEVDTDEGMHVKEGQIIARLDCSESDAALAAAKADRIATQSSMEDLQVNLANADRELKRTQQLTDAGVSTPQALDAARTLTDSYRARIALTKQQVAAADRKIDVAQENVNNCTIRERDYYDKQSRTLTTLIVVLGTIVAVVMGIGAVFGALNTMYSAVAERSREIAIMRALGFGAGSVVLSFLIEALLISFLGGALGCLVVIPLNGLTTGAMNFQTFSYLAFAFRVTPDLLLGGIAFALFMGLVGGVPPAIRAARQPVSVALRAL